MLSHHPCTHVHTLKLELGAHNAPGMPLLPLLNSQLAQTSKQTMSQQHSLEMPTPTTLGPMIPRGDAH